MQKITPFLWFDGNVEEAINFYTCLFKNGTVTSMYRLAPGQKVFTGNFSLAGQALMALDGGPKYKFTPAISFFVNCETEQEIDALWSGIKDGGIEMMPLAKYPFSEKFGWVQDKFGLNWQLSLTGSEQKVMPFLMYVNKQNGKAEEAMQFYCSIFKNSEIQTAVQHKGGDGGDAGALMMGTFRLDGQDFMARDSNYAHDFDFNPATSFFINCEDQAEVDELWERLTEGGGESRCGWVWDKYGVSWQVIPKDLMKLLYSDDAAASQRAMQAMLKMDKIIVADLWAAWRGEV